MVLTKCLDFKTETHFEGEKIGSLEVAFEDMLIEAIDDVFCSLGTSFKQAIYSNLENQFKIRRKDVPYKIGEFKDAIEKIFGLGARILEIKIMNALHEKVQSFRYYIEEDTLSFENYLESLRCFLLA